MTTNSFWFQEPSLNEKGITFLEDKTEKHYEKNETTSNIGNYTEEI